MSPSLRWARPLLACAAVWPLLGVSAEPDPGAPASPALARWVARGLADNPELLAARADIATAEARLAGAGRSLYNPELEYEYEDTDVLLNTLELSQTLDWHDKRGARDSSAQAALAAVHAQVTAARARLATELLDALGRYQSSQRLVALAARRSRLLERFRDLTERRAAAGDVATTALQLARLARVEAVLQEAERRDAVIEAEASLRRLAGEPGGSLPGLPETLPTGDLERTDEQALLRAHPAVRAARLRARAAAGRVRLEDRERRPDPTLALKGGREDHERLIGIRVVLPLQVRNDFRSQVAVARGEADRAEKEALEVFRRAEARLAGARRRYAVTASAWSLWQAEGRGGLEARLRLLERLWTAGEVSTTDYLVQLQQALDTQIAGAELRGRRWQSWLAWRSAAGRVMSWLGER